MATTFFLSRLRNDRSRASFLISRVFDLSCPVIRIFPTLLPSLHGKVYTLAVESRLRTSQTGCPPVFPKCCAH